MKQMLRLLFVGLLGGLCLALEAEQCRTSYRGKTMLFCCDTSSGKTCFTTFLDINNHTVSKPFEEASRWCKSGVPGSSLIIINSLESRSTVESFIRGQVLENETIVIDAQKLSARNSAEWSWVNGHKTIPTNVRTEALPGLDGACVELKHGQSLAYCTGTHQSRNRYICEYSESNSTFSYRHNNKSYVASDRAATWHESRNECLQLGGDLASITDLQMIENWSRLKESQSQKYWIGLHRNKWIWNSTGAALTYTNWKDGHPDESFDKQCICVNPQCRRENKRTFCEYDGKWRTCNCKHNYAIVCQNKEETPGAVSTEIDVARKTLSSTSKDFKSSVSLSDNATTNSRSSSSSSSASSSTSSATKSPPISSTTATKRGSSETNPTGRTITTTISNTTSTNKAISGSRPTRTNPTSPNTRPNIVTTTSANTLITTTRTKITTAMTKPVISTVTTTTITDHTAGEISGLFKSFKTKEILLILFFVAVIFIVVAIIFIIRKRKYYRRNEGTYMKNTKQSETVSPAYTTVVPANITSEGTVTSDNPTYAEVEMTQQPTPSSNAIYASVQPTSEAVDMGKSIVYSDLNFPQKGKQKPRSADKIAACLSPIYSTPYEPRTSATNTEYAEPFKPEKRPTATAPVINHNAAVDQQNIYSLAKAIPLGDPNVIYSKPNKPTKSSTPTGKAVKATGPIYLNMIEVKPGAESESVAIQDPTAVYAEQIKLKKSP